MKIALAFWGITRSLKYTIGSIQRNILDQLKDHQYTIFMHTYRFKSKYHNPRANEVDIQLNFNEYKLLKPDFIKIDDQDKVKSELNVDMYKTHPDPWNTEYITVENFICAMYSKSKVVEMIKTLGLHFDYIVFLRPDVQYLTPLHTSFLLEATKDTICIPDFHKFSNFNDRFCIATYTNGLIYGDLFKHMLDYSKANKLHSETFQHYCITNLYSLRVKFIPFYFNRVRADGNVKEDCQS